MRAIDLWALTADLDELAPLKAKIGDNVLNVTGYNVDQSAATLTLKVKDAGTPRTLASYIALAQQPTVRKLIVRVAEADGDTGDGHNIFGCNFHAGAIILH